MVKSLETPTTNRGVVNTSNTGFTLINKGLNGQEGVLEQFILIDWFQFTILFDNFDFDNGTGEINFVRDVYSIVINLFKDFFNINSNDLVLEYKGINGYNVTYSYNDIKIMFNINRPEMGIHILLSGSGCRDFESLGLDYFDLFSKINNYIVNYNRIDVSIDDFTSKYFDLDKLIYYIKYRLCVSKFRSVLNINKIKLDDTCCLGNTLQFGSRASNVQITFYDKLKERKSKDIIVSSNINSWIRCELRFRGDSAKQIIDSFLQNKDSINSIIKGILYNYLDFKVFGSNDSNISRRASEQWWLDYLDNVDKLKLTNYLPETSITKKRNWLINSISKSQLMVYISNLDLQIGDTITNEFILDLLKSGSDFIQPKDLQVINDYRIKNKLSRLSISEIKDYILDLKNYLGYLD